MQEKIQTELETTKDYIFLFDRNESLMEAEIVPLRNTNIMDFLNIGSVHTLWQRHRIQILPINFHVGTAMPCFYVKELLQVDPIVAEEHPVDEEPIVDEHPVVDQVVVEEDPVAEQVADQVVEQDVEEQTTLCSVCFSNKKNVVFMPCRHMACCEMCASNQNVTNCVLCRTPIEQTIVVFI
jgi:hypothetical protein